MTANRSAAGTASPPIRLSRPVPWSACRRSGRSPQCAKVLPFLKVEQHHHPKQVTDAGGTRLTLTDVELGNQHVVLIGMMGAGKTTVGRLLAKRLGWGFWDNDEALQKETGHTAGEFQRE